MKLTLYERQAAWNAVNLAKKCLREHDPHMANFALRDLDATKEAGLSDLAWAMHQSGSLHKNDVLGLIEHLEKYLLEQEVPA